jgi:hypothetical protein
MLPTCTDLGKAAVWWGGLPIIIPPPACEAAIYTHPTGMMIARTHLGKAIFRRVKLAKIAVAPAGDAVVSPQPAGVQTACTDPGKAAVRGAALPKHVVAPAGNTAIRSDSTCMKNPRTDLGKVACWRSGLAASILPAVDFAISALFTDGAIAISSPAGDATIPALDAGMYSARADGGDSVRAA